ncbi:MAG: hypothetical protein NT172_02660 [Planctomycetota bacterium]|nr:hypothetical protein [Planctomycetota bacterium]
MTIHYQQAIYGAFPFWDKGYAILARSEGCRDEWVSDFTHICQSLGQPPSEASPAFDQLIMAKKLPSGPWLVAMGFAQGCDDRGRPGAWAFHGIFLTGHDYRKASLFQWKDFFLREFQSGMTLSAGQISVSDLRLAKADESQLVDDSLLQRLHQGRKVRFLTEDPEELKWLEAIWNQSSAKVRARRSITTWAFRPDADFDLAAISPSRWPNFTPEKSYRMWAITSRQCQWIEPVEGSRDLKGANKKTATILSALALAAIGLIIFWPRDKSEFQKHAMEQEKEQVDRENKPQIASNLLNRNVPANVKAAVMEKLADWHDRLELDQADDTIVPSAFAKRIVAKLRYSGPLANLSQGDEAGRKTVALDCMRNLSKIRSWPEDSPQGTMESAVYTLSILAWCLNEPELQAVAGNLNSPAEVRGWFDSLRDRLLPRAILEQVSADLQQSGPEWSEFRLHLNRLIRLQ